MEDKKIIKASRIYSQNIALRTVVNLIPYVGSAMDIILTSQWSRITEKRLNDFLEFTKKEFDNINNKSINKEFIESDDFVDLTVKCLTTATKTRNQKKIALLAKILKNAAISKRFEYDEFEEILPTFEQVSIRELTILVHLNLWENNLKNNYIKMLNYSEIRRSAAPNFPPGIPVYLGFWDAFLDDVNKLYKINKEDSEYLLHTSAQKGLFLFEPYSTVKFNTYAARESFDHTMKGKLTPLFFKLKKFVLDSN